MTRKLVFALTLFAALPLFAASDVLTVNSMSAQRGTVAAVAVYVRDVSGTPLGMDQPAANRIQGIGFKVTWSPASAVSAATFTRAGVLQGLTPLYETTLLPGGSVGYVGSFAQSTNPVPFTLDAASPGNLIGNLSLTIPQNVAAGTVISLTVESNTAALSNQAGTVIETGNNGKLAIVNGAITVTAAGGATAAVRSDFNGNQKSDLWWRNTTSGENYIWYTNTSAYAGGATPPPVPTSYAFLGTGDFNNDGRADVLWRHVASGSLSVWFMNGGTLTGGLTLPAVGAQYIVGGIGDFNGDGYADILWRDTSSGTNSIWYITASGFTGGVTPPAVPTNFTIGAVADFNGDGRADIFWRDNTGAIYTWLMNGGTIIGGGRLATVPSAYVLAGTGDFNADGKFDLVWRNTSTGENSIWYINGSGLWSGAGLTLPTVPNSYAIAGVGDFNGDGGYDLVWRNASSGDDSIWLINNGLVGGINLPPVAGSALQIVAPK